MTPSTIFQWPLSPAGIFQPERSLPLKSDTKPASSSAAEPMAALAARMAATNNKRMRACMTETPATGLRVLSPRGGLLRPLYARDTHVPTRFFPGTPAGLPELKNFVASPSRIGSYDQATPAKRLRRS